MTRTPAAQRKKRLAGCRTPRDPPGRMTAFQRRQAKGPSGNKVCILARAPGGQMQGAATQAMWGHRQGAATPQMPARRRAPQGCGPQAQQNYCGFPVVMQLGMGAAAKCQIILARALSASRTNYSLAWDWEEGAWGSRARSTSFVCPSTVTFGKI